MELYSNQNQSELLLMIIAFTSHNLDTPQTYLIPFSLGAFEFQRTPFKEG